MGHARRRLYTEPTPMGERLLAFMSANYVKDLEEFAEGLVGVPLATLLSWIYGPVDPETIPVKPLLVCADALGTNIEYLACISDDPRPRVPLTYDENVLLQAFRDAEAEGQSRLMKAALEIAAGSPARPHSASPYPNVPVRRRIPPANET